MAVAVQKIKKGYDSPLAVAIRYYSLMSAVGEWSLTPRQIELMAFTAVRGTISSGGAKETFIHTFSSSKGTLANMKALLLKRGLLVKKDGKTIVNPQVVPDFNLPILIQIQLYAKTG